MLEVTATGDAAAGRPRAFPVAYLDQMAEPVAGIVRRCLVPVIAVGHRDRLKVHGQVRTAGGQAQPPGPVPAGWAGWAGSAGWASSRTCGASGPGAAGRFGASVASGLTVLVGDGYAPGGGGVGDGRHGQVTGQVGIDGAKAGGVPRTVSQAEQGGQGNSQAFFVCSVSRLLCVFGCLVVSSQSRAYLARNMRTSTMRLAMSRSLNVTTLSMLQRGGTARPCRRRHHRSAKSTPGPR